MSIDALDQGTVKWRADALGQTDILLDPDADYGPRREAAIALFDLLSAAIGLDDIDPMADDIQETLLPSGRAVSPRMAARCVWDFARTSMFLRGTRAAINAARNEFPGETVRVLYAGCGPFAILALPIAHEWASDEVSFTLLDCHARSLDAARHLARRFGVSDRIDGFVQADASSYRCPNDAQPHVLVTETMQRALAEEPQVAITRNLAPQLLSGGILVPERIELHVTLADPGREFTLVPDTTARDRVELGTAMVLDKNGDRCANLLWPDQVSERMESFIRTHIQVSGDLCLGDYESGLTGIAPLPLDRCPEPGQELRFQYRLEPQPGLICTVDAA